MYLDIYTMSKYVVKAIMYLEKSKRTVLQFGMEGVRLFITN